MSGVDSLERILLDTKDGSFEFVHPAQDRLIAARELEGKGLSALGVIGSYWMITGSFIEETCSEIPRVLQDVWRAESKKYAHLSSEDLIHEIAKDVLGYSPKDDDVLPDEKYEKIYSTAHCILQPAMIMGRMDCGFGRVKTNTMKGLLEGYRSWRQIMS